jgi:DNA-binding transcriptional MocR family regulator
VTAAHGSASDEALLVLENRFAIVPERVIDADVSDAAFRLYAVLLRYGQSSGARMPSRSVLAARLKKRSTDTVDRALKELVSVGAVVVERRRRGRENLTNRYYVMSTPPGARPGSAGEGGRTDAATRSGRSGGRRSAARGGRTDAVTLAAGVRPDPGVLTQQQTPPASPASATVATAAAASSGSRCRNGR